MTSRSFRFVWLADQICLNMVLDSTQALISFYWNILYGQPTLSDKGNLEQMSSRVEFFVDAQDHAVFTNATTPMSGVSGRGGPGWKCIQTCSYGITHEKT
ncbi:hypothetical protein BD414DRAFT_13168 [Trametes punicea]|nr:hypothetical protein BD414DRAFT_13168 [Trametes punicea]